MPFDKKKYMGELKQMMNKVITISDKNKLLDSIEKFDQKYKEYDDQIIKITGEDQVFYDVYTDYLYSIIKRLREF